MIGIALEGGGARGSYEAGAYIALRKNHIKPKIIAGTSIGALNAALIAQGDLKKLVNLWQNTTTDIFEIDSKLTDKLKNKELTSDDIKEGFEEIKKILKNKGIDTSKYLKIIKENINEEKLRKSKIKFGMITVKAKGLKPIEIIIDDIPEGKVAEYILASSYLPVFKFVPIIDNNYYLDGGFYNKLPLSLLENYGCDTIYSIKINGIGISNNKLKKNTKIIEVKPKENLGSIIIFNKESNEYNMQLGYFDALRVIKKLDGDDYYFKQKTDNYYNHLVRNIDKSKLNLLKIKYHTKSNKKLTIRIFEKILEKNNISKFKILNPTFELRKIKKYYKITGELEEEFIKSCKIL